MQYTIPNLFTSIEEGTFSFAYGISPYLFSFLVALIVGAVWLTYLRTTRPLSTAWKTFFVVTRSSVLVILLFCLLRPVITTFQVAPQETYLGMLIDDSQSMSIEDLDAGQSRRQGIEENIFRNGLVDELSESFQIRTFRFDKETQRIAGLDGLTEEGTASSIDQALKYVDDQLNGLPLGGLVLVTDGADNGENDPVNQAKILAIVRFLSLP